MPMYWIKLRRLTLDEMNRLMAEDARFVVLYITLADDRVKLLPYDVDTIQCIVGYFDRETVAEALEHYKRLGLIYIEADNALKIVR